MTDPTPETSAATAAPPPPPFYRWTVLVVISLAMFGNYYVYDAVSPLADVLKAQLGFSDSAIGTLQAIYSLPNVVMVLLGGFLIDRLGVKKSLVLFGILCSAGAFLTVATPSFPVMAAGRLVFGLGAESLIVAVTTALARWFKGKELSFAFGINLTIARLGSFLALNSPSWARDAYATWRAPLLLAAMIGLLCTVCAVVYWAMDSRAARSYAMGAAGATDKVVWGDLLRFGRSYWLVVALCVTFYSGIFPFQTFAVKMFMDVHGTTRAAGGFLSSLLTLAAMFLTPLFGLLVDRIGKRATLMTIGSLLLVPVYQLLLRWHSVATVTTPDLMPFLEPAVLPASLLVPIAMMGTAFSLIPAVMWPSVAYLVPEGKLGTAYGLMTMVQNIGLAGFNWMIGAANDASGASAANPGGYALGMWIFSSLGFIGFFFAFFLRRRETGPDRHGLETITTSHPKG